MLLNLLKTFGLKALYVVAALVISFLVQALAGFQPPTDPLGHFIWTWVLLPGLTGLVALLKRLLTWNPEKLGK
jgi:hypothetical protein